MARHGAEHRVAFSLPLTARTAFSPDTCGAAVDTPPAAPQPNPLHTAGRSEPLRPFSPDAGSILCTIKSKTPADRPTIVVLCGLTRYWERIAEANQCQTAAGRTVLAPGWAITA